MPIKSVAEVSTYFRVLGGEWGVGFECDRQIPGQEFFDSIDWQVGDTGEHGAKVADLATLENMDCFCQR